MSLPSSLVDIADSRIIAVIAWKLNIHYKLWRYKITVITASRAYLPQNLLEILAWDALGIPKLELLCLLNSFYIISRPS